MMSGNNPAECFLSSLQSVKVAFLPLESSIQKAVKDLECFWPDNRLVEVLAQSNIANGVNEKVQIFSVKQRNVQISGGRCQDLLMSDGEREKDARVEASLCANCSPLATIWFPMLKRLMQSLPNPFRTSTKCIHKSITSCLSGIHGNNPASIHEQELQNSLYVKGRRVEDEESRFKPMECLIGFICDQINRSFQKFDHGLGDNRPDICESSETSTSQSHLLNTTVKKGRKVGFSGFLGNLKFARVGHVSQSLVDVDSLASEEGQSCNTEGSREESGGISPQKLTNGLLTIPLPNVERLRSTLSTVSLAELIQLIPHLGQPTNDYPDKKKLFSVQDFFRYTETEGMKFFEELDRDGDGHVTLEDLDVAMKKRKLPQRYARDFMSRTKRHIFSKSFGWKQFLSLMKQKEPTILRAYTSLCLSKSGTLHKSEILVSLKNAGLPANEENAVAMMRFLNADTKGSISYGHFRNFMLLLPSDRLQDDPRSIWFEAATVVAVPPPVEIPAGSVLRSALAGGLASALSTSLLHPIDTIKTRVQASTLSFTEVISKLPEIGVQGLYRGAIPAILGQFSSHGLRTGIFEASKLLLIHFAPSVPEIQVQSLASFCSTFLGTAVRIPCEVLKQRLQAGIFDNVGEAIVCTWHQDGLNGFFRGTAATLCREVPFYVAGMGLYAESKKAAQGLLRRELEPWETIAVGAVSGGLAAVVTTPFDVMKTRMMTAPPGQSASMATVAFSILRHEGPLGLFKGAIPRFFWIAPLGAMNFAGYELARKAMDQTNDTVSDHFPQNKLVTAR